MIKKYRVKRIPIWALFMGTLLMAAYPVISCAAPSGAASKIRIFIVSSYHPEYMWSQETAKGVSAALVDFQFLDGKEQAEEFMTNDFIETDKAVIKKVWMDTKRKSSRSEIIVTASNILSQINAFNPGLLLLGDDNAANYIGTQFIDTGVPTVFWGIDGYPLKYGLIDSLETPGHNITGVYQSGYYVECLEYLIKLVPGVKTFAILSDDSETGRAKAKVIMKLQQEGKLPAKLIETVLTNSFSDWQSAALRLASEVDAFFILNHNTLKDAQSNPVEPRQVVAWYFENIKKPECVPEQQWVKEGALIAVDDSGFKQGYEAVRRAAEIIFHGKDPGHIPVSAPSRGAIVVNTARARFLGIDLGKAAFIEEYVE
jgi:putative tryptophan/tyrosine transport system substrate-binding protein